MLPRNLVGETEIGIGTEEVEEALAGIVEDGVEEF